MGASLFAGKARAEAKRERCFRDVDVGQARGPVRTQVGTLVDHAVLLLVSTNALCAGREFGRRVAANASGAALQSPAALIAR